MAKKEKEPTSVAKEKYNPEILKNRTRTALAIILIAAWVIALVFYAFNIESPNATAYKDLFQYVTASSTGLIGYYFGAVERR